MFCQSCGNQIPDNAKFCSRCGAKVDVATPSPSDPSTVSMQPAYSKNSSAAAAVQPQRSPQKAVPILLGIIALFLAAMLIFMRTSSSKDYSELLVGEWYADPDIVSEWIDPSYPFMTFYENGVCMLIDEMLTWSIVHDDELRIAGFFGEAVSFFDGDDKLMKIASLRGGRLVLENLDGTQRLVLFDEPVD